ncbi:MAG TPA: hydrogen gas-evolving membrane-bound hydrogenase subunit E [Acidimicrobiia bacterium]|nr:hydrogen gas-evolving membrane-bound hydrogenase subunit E [Acidimicrobiia bacterium]
MLVLLLLHVAVALAAPALTRRWGRRVFLFCALAPAAAVVWALPHAARALDGHPIDEHTEWAPALGLELAFRLDGFALLMVALVSGIGVLIFVYASSYFAGQDGPHERARLGAFAAELTAFAGSMLGIVLADNVLVLFAFWELTSVTSFLLIGFDDDRGDARAAAVQAFLVTSAGGLAMLAGLVLLGQAAGTGFSLSGMLAAPPSGSTVTAALLLVLVGAFAKSAQLPFHFWLPNAMVAPTPVSAYLHSATMVKAGVYLIARLAPAFAENGVWRPAVVGVGLATMVFGGARALRQHDLTLLLALGTISQLGFLTALFGIGTDAAVRAGVALLLAHGVFKAGLFMVVGIVDHQAHTRDLRRLSGLGRRLPGLAAVAAVAALSMAGVPPLLGFVAKESVYEALVHSPLGTTAGIALVGIVVGSVLTVAYTARFLWGTFATKTPADVERPIAGAEVPRPPAAFVLPAVLLAGVTVVLGAVPRLLDRFLNGAAAALDPAVVPESFQLWHGVGEPLMLSALTLAAGLAVWLGGRGLERRGARLPGLPNADGAYQRTVRGIALGADRVTGVVQNGSLPVYLAVVLLTVLALPGFVLVRDLAWPEGLTAAESPVQVGMSGLVVVAALATAATHRRFVAVLSLGAVGFGVAVLFVIQGAPDLALTLFLVETLALVIFVLVLRHLPERFRRPPGGRGPQLAKIAVAGASGALVTLFLLVAGSARTAEPVSSEFVARSLPEAGGRNVVNVILVDFRGFDTLGEITVLAVSALGIASLMLAGRAAATGESREGKS